ncbi:MAG: ferritin family protein [candidate division Zixibacteria bacterium]|jgi:rubrerythrin|nr:ferritin family protein [candidate division Zixibacteria bacterium]
MNVFDFAMKMEQDGRAFYLEHADKVSHPQLKKILLELADDEAKHYAIFKALRDGQPTAYDEASRTGILNTVKNVFEELKAGNRVYSFPADARKIWAQAQEVEKKSENFYREKANEVGDKNQKHILNKIADEEHKHWVTMENVIRFLDRPKTWLEDAEWSNLEEY